MQAENRRELWGVVQAFGSVYCCVLGTWTVLHPLGSQSPHGGGLVSPHLTWWQVVMLAGFIICALVLALGALVNLLSRGTRSESTETPSASWARYLTAYAEISGPPPPGKEAAKKPQKVRIEFLNCTDFSYKVKVISWEPGSRGLYANFWRECLQLRIVNTWCPEWNGVSELHVPPGEAFRFWLFPEADFSNEQFRARINLGNLGTIHLLIDGKEIAVPVK